MRIPGWLWLTTALAALAPVAVGADTVRTKDGSVIHGEVLELKNDELVIDTDYADEVSIEVEYIVDIEAERKFTIQYKDGRRADGYLTISPEGKIVLTGKKPAEKPGPDEEAAPPYDVVPPSEQEEGMPSVDAELAGQTIDVDEIRWMDQYETYYRYFAALNIGLEAQRGNSDTTDFHFDALLQPSFGLNTLIFKGAYDKKEADGNTTTDQWLAEGSYRRRFERRWFAFGLNRWQADAQQDLDLRMLIGAGPGYYFFEDDPTHLNVYGGIAYVRENFSGTTNDRNFAAYFWNTDFDRDLYKDDITFYHDHSFIGAFDEADNIIIQTATGLKFDIWGGLNLSAEIQFDWTNKPAAGRDKDDTRYFLKLGYEVEGDETDWWQP